MCALRVVEQLLVFDGEDVVVAEASAERGAIGKVVIDEVYEFLLRYGQPDISTRWLIVPADIPDMIEQAFSQRDHALKAIASI